MNKGMKKILIKSLTGCTIDDKSQIGIIHAEHPITDITLCGDGTEEYIFEYTKKQITCKNCLKIIRYCEGLI